MVASALVRIIVLFPGVSLIGQPLASILIVVGFVGVFLGRPRPYRA